MAPLLAPLCPVLARFRARLRAALAAAPRRAEGLTLDADALESAWSERLARRWLWMSLPTLVLELNCARMLEQLEGDTPEARFESFVAGLREPERAAALFAEYGVLARQIDDRARQSLEASLELVARLTADGPLIRRTFFDGADPGPVVEADAGAGDTHADGRSVVLLHFARGARLVYKPRPLAVDAHFRELVDWLAARGAPESLRAPRVLDGGHHGWVEHVAAAPCADEDAVRRYHVRLGALLAVLHAVRAVDVHFENLIAAGEHPVLVDLETLFHPTPPSLAARTREHRATASALEDSVLRVGLLPYRVNGEDAEADLSGVAAASGQQAPDPVLRWRDVGRDDMHAVREPLPLEPGHNRPTLAGREIDPTAHAEAMSGGFRAMRAWLVRERDLLLPPEGPLRRFARDRVRVVMRPTRVYGLLIDESWNPDVLREEAARDALFDRLQGLSDAVELRAVAKSERDDLRAGDVPVFTSQPGSRHLWDSRGESRRDLFAESALDEACRRLAAMDERDVEREAWLVRAALGMEVLNRDRGEWSAYVLARGERAPSHEAQRARLLVAARSLGRWFERMAVGDDERATWIALDFRANGWTLNAEATDLYSGVPGIVLFLARLGALTGDESFTRLARRGLCATLEALGRTEPARLERGLFQGLAGTVYTLAHCAALWRDDALVREALARLGALERLCEADEELDVVAGGAGVIAAALALEHVARDGRALALARACGERLAAVARDGPDGPLWWNRLSGEEPATGFAHGTSGIAHALLLLARTTGAQALRARALAALRAESAWLRPSIERWRTSESPAPAASALAGSAERTLSMSWCYGLPGLLVARLAAVESGAAEAARVEAVALAEVVARRGFGKNHCLCHGDLGNLDVLLLAARTLGMDALRDECAGWTAAVLDSAEDGGWRCGTMAAVEAPGLMNGLAGIGYGLLRLADPDSVPSLLALEAPRDSSGAGAAPHAGTSVNTATSGRTPRRSGVT